MLTRSIATTAATFALIFAAATPASANPFAAALLSPVAGASANADGGNGFGLGLGGAGGKGGAGGNSGPLTSNPTQTDKTKVDGSIGIALGQAPGAIAGCMGEVRLLGGYLAQFPTTVPGVCAQLLAGVAIASPDMQARTQGLAIMNKFALQYFGDDTKPAVGGDAAFRQ